MRSLKLDLIRFFGVLIIMVAHSGPPAWLFQLRNFGTPLLILGSALTYSYIYRHKPLNITSFLKKRLTRLTFPLWIFLTFFFLFFWLTSLIFKDNFPFSQSKIINSFILYRGIDFVWIFKVYIILALITPYTLKLSQSSISNKRYFGLIVIIYIVYECITYLFLTSNISADIKRFIIQFVLVIIPYTLLYLYGLRLHLFNYKTLNIIILSSLLLFIILAIQKYIEFGGFVPTQKYKYPPTIYYLSYAFFCINLFYYLVNRFISVSNKKFENLIIWLSSNSLWIYLWHILAFYIWESYDTGFIRNTAGYYLNFLCKTVYLLMFGVVMTYIQINIINKIILKENESYKGILIFLK